MIKVSRQRPGLNLMPKKKPKIAIISLTSCEGCEVAILDLGEKLLEVLKDVELINFKYMMEAEVSNFRGCDITFVEGSPSTARDINLLQEVRKNSKAVIALGTCAHLGGVQKIKDYRDKKEVYKYVYGMQGKGENNDGGGILKYIKVDAVIPGCPITKEEFLRCVSEILAGKIFAIEENPVCYECLNNGNECLLQKGEICLGPLTYAGCDAICVKSKQGCWGCRGFLPEIGGKDKNGELINKKFENFKNKLQEMMDDDQINSIQEVFGVRDKI